MRSCSGAWRWIPRRDLPTCRACWTHCRHRDAQRDRRPLVILGLLGPLLFLLVTAWFACAATCTPWTTPTVCCCRARESNGFAADFVAEAVARRIEGYFRAGGGRSGPA